MDPKQYRDELAALIDSAFELTNRLHTLMDKIPGPEAEADNAAGTAEWNFIYGLSRLANGISDTLYQTLYPKPSAFSADSDA